MLCFARRTHRTHSEKLSCSRVRSEPKPPPQSRHNSGPNPIKGYYLWVQVALRLDEAVRTKADAACVMLEEARRTSQKQGGSRHTKNMSV